jgi:hypothetical protein
MARIKSALELALEKTESVKVDKDAMKAHELRQDAKKTASLFLNDSENIDLEQKLKDFSKEDQQTAREAVLEVFLANITLPSNELALARVSALAKGISVLCKDKKTPALMDQIKELYKQYLDDMKNLDAACRKQFAPKLRQKEEQLAKRMGQQVRIDPMQDPEFVAFFQNNLSRVQQQYEAALVQARSQVKAIFEASSPGGSKLFR